MGDDVKKGGARKGKRETERLGPLTPGRLIEPGRYADGRGLYLYIGLNGSKSWVLRYQLRGKSREMGLGAFPDLSLKGARAAAQQCRAQLVRGIDPLDARYAEEARLAAEAARAVTFKSCCESYIAAHEAGWRNAKHRQQWRNTLWTYAYPIVGALPVATIDTGLVVQVLEPIWNAKPETAARVRGRIEAVLDWAKTRGYRDGENPARWRGHLSNLLPARSKVRRVVHHPALPYEDVHDFILKLRQREALTALALEFVILTVPRTSELLGMRKPEFRLAERVWVIPPARMKAEKEHRVPLCARAVKILETVWPLSDDDGFVFPGDAPGLPLSNMAMLTLLKRMKRTDITVHGFRSTFRDWAAECTSFPEHVAEMALAHAVSDKVKAAYQRRDLFEKRRRLMDAWALHCETPYKRGEVIEFRAASA